MYLSGWGVSRKQALSPLRGATAGGAAASDGAESGHRYRETVGFMRNYGQSLSGEAVGQGPRPKRDSIHYCSEFGRAIVMSAGLLCEAGERDRWAKPLIIQQGIKIIFIGASQVGRGYPDPHSWAPLYESSITINMTMGASVAMVKTQQPGRK